MNQVSRCCADRSDLEVHVRFTLADVLGFPPGVFDGRTDLAEYGLDSIDAVDLIGELEEHLGIRIPHREMVGLRTVDGIVGYLVARRDELPASIPDLHVISRRVIPTE